MTAYENGFTPNPDIMCNKHIKFNSFARYCLDKLGVDAFATGHYARSSFGIDLEDRHTNKKPLLMRPTDRVKDQTFWLCQIDVAYLSRCMFPLANINKCHVKRVASTIGLHKILARKESMGICFIGKRKFRDFIDSYIEPKKGLFTLLETGEVIGEHRGVHHFTLGQKTGLSRGSNAAYVAHINPHTQQIQVVLDGNHPALFMRQMVTSEPHWLIDHDAGSIGNFRARFQYQNKYCSIPCSVTVQPDNGGCAIQLDQSFRCVSPGQFAVLYSQDDEICIGSSQILSSRSLWQEGHRESISWNLQDYENRYLFDETEAHVCTRLE